MQQELIPRDDSVVPLQAIGWLSCFHMLHFILFQRCLLQTPGWYFYLSITNTISPLRERSHDSCLRGVSQTDALLFLCVLGLGTPGERDSFSHFAAAAVRCCQCRFHSCVHECTLLHPPLWQFDPWPCCMMAALHPVKMTDVQPSTSKGLPSPVIGVRVVVCWISCYSVCWSLASDKNELTHVAFQLQQSVGRT